MNQHLCLSPVKPLHNSNLDKSNKSATSRSKLVRNSKSSLASGSKPTTRSWLASYQQYLSACLATALILVASIASGFAHAASAPNPNQPKAPVFEVTPLTPPSEGVGISPDPNSLSGTGIFATGTNANTSNNKNANTNNDPQSAKLTNSNPSHLLPAKPYLGGADFTGGYALTVLQKIIPYWEPPAGSHTLQFSLRIGNDGRTLFCEPKTHTNNPALDQSGCAAALKAGSFGPPPYGAVAEIFLSLATDALALSPKPQGTTGIAPAQNSATNPQTSPANRSSGNAPAVDLALGNMPPLVKQEVAPAKRAVADPNLSYAEQVVRNARPYLVVPPGLNGSFTTEVSLEASPAGMISSLNISKPSGNKAADDAVLNALRTPGILPLPGASPKTLRLTFTLTGN